jgi:hypothetical protein
MLATAVLMLQSRLRHMPFAVDSCQTTSITESTCCWMLLLAIVLLPYCYVYRAAHGDLAVYMQEIIQCHSLLLYLLLLHS